MEQTQMNVHDLFDPEDPLAEYLSPVDWAWGQRALDSGVPDHEVETRLAIWADDFRQEAQCEAAEYQASVGYYDNCD